MVALRAYPGVGRRHPAPGIRHPSEEPAGGQWGSGMAGRITSYRDLDVWQRAFELTSAVYDATENMPDGERFGLTYQIRRSAVSVPSNIADGYGRGSRVEYGRFLKIARGSLYELETQLLIAESRGWLDDHDRLEALCRSAGQLLAALIASLERT